MEWLELLLGACVTTTVIVCLASIHQLYQLGKIKARPFPVISSALADRLIRVPYDEYLQTPQWKERRHIMLERFGHRCQLCNEKSSLGNHLEVHHRTYERRGNELPEDLTVLCRKCHDLFHARSW